MESEQPGALRPCPGCGQERNRVIGGPGTVGGPKYWCGCDLCNWRTWGDTEAEAIAAWNSRHAPSPDVAGLTERLQVLLARVQECDRPLPWVVHTGCSYRRIASEATAENGYRSFPDGNVLHAYKQRSDGHPDLSMGEAELNALVEIINLQPQAAATIADLKAKLEESEAERVEQARLLGMSGERELRLLAKLEVAREGLESIESGTYPRPVEKAWMPDGKPSKHDRCAHGVWMYETCEGCIDTFVTATLAKLGERNG